MEQQKINIHTKVLELHLYAYVDLKHEHIHKALYKIMKQQDKLADSQVLQPATLSSMMTKLNIRRSRRLKHKARKNKSHISYQENVLI